MLIVKKMDDNESAFQAFIKKEYYNIDNRFNVKSIYAKVKDKFPKVTYNDVKDVIKNQESYQVFKRPVKKNFPLIANYPFERLQCDLLDLSNKNPVKNNGYKWLMNIVDVYTRYSFSIPLKNKGDSECLNAFKKVIKEIQTKYYETPIQLDSDNEASFKSNAFIQFCEVNKIKQNFSRPDDFKSKGCVESFNRTIRSIIEKIRVAYNTENWVSYIPKIIASYNVSYHSGILTTPSNAIINNNRYEIKINKILNEATLNKQSGNPHNTQVQRNSLKIGEKVRILLHKNYFIKGTKPNWSSTVHEITKIEQNPTRIYVNNRVLFYKMNEIQKVNSVEFNDNNDHESIETRERVNNNVRDYNTNRRVERRMNQEGLNNPNENIVTDENARVMRRFKPRRDLGAMITDY